MAKIAQQRAPFFTRRRPVFDVRRHHVHAQAVVTSERPLTIRTPPQRWAHALSFMPAWPPLASTRDGLVRIRLRVIEGDVSVLCLAADGVRVIDEAFTGPADGDLTLALAAAPLSACAEVVVRNARTDGRPSVATIGSIEWEDVGEAETGDTLRPPGRLALEPVPNWSRCYGERGMTADERLRSARYVMLDRVKRMRWFNGLNVNIVPNDDLSRVLYVSGTYEPLSLLAMHQLLPEGGVFVDVGANAGVFSMLASRWVGPRGRVFSFEPNAREFARLDDHVALNALGNVTTIRKVVADRSAWFDLRVAQFPHAGHNTTADRFAYDGVAAERTERVEGITLDQFIADAGVSRLDLVKVDVEGGERAVLDGAVQVMAAYRPAWIMEVSRPALANQRTSAGDLLRRLSAASYRPLNRVSLVESSHDTPPAEDPSDNLIAVPAERTERDALRHNPAL